MMWYARAQKICSKLECTDQSHTTAHSYTDSILLWSMWARVW